MNLTTKPKIKVISPPSPSMKTKHLMSLMLDPRGQTSTTPHSPLRNPDKELQEEPKMDTKMMAATLKGGHFYELLEKKGLDQLEVEKPKKPMITISDVLEGIKTKKKEKKPNNMAKILLAGMAIKLDCVVDEAKEIQRQNISKKIPDLFNQFQMN